MLVGQKVVHKKFGDGEIRALDGNVLSVQFGESLKKFVYPQAFELGLRLYNTELMQQIRPDVEKNARHQADRRRREERFYKDKAAHIKKNSAAELTEKRKMPSGNVAFKCETQDIQLPQWTLSAGQEQKNGKLRRLMQIQPGKLCMMTKVDPEDKEVDRYIYAVFMISEKAAQMGKLQGLVVAEDSLKLQLTPERAKELRFWKYYSTKSGRPAWGSGAFRYVDDGTTLTLLQDIEKLMTNTEMQNTAVQLLESYRQHNPAIVK